MDASFPAGDFRMGEWLAQPSLDRLARGQASVRIRPRLMDLLVVLAGRAGQVVAKDALIEAVWGRRFVAESALSTAIAQLRAALGDDAAAPRYIESVPKRGYRLIAPVEPVGDASAEDREARCALLVSGRRVPLREGEHVIGRAPDAEVRIDATDVSRRHAVVVVRGGDATIADLGSKNGTFVGRERVTGPRPLADGDRVVLGTVVVAFRLSRCVQTTVTVEER